MAVVITLPPTPKPASTLAAYEQNVNIWTRQCQQLLQQLSSAIEASSASIPIADATHTGLLSSADWITFNSKQPPGAYLTDAPSDGTIYGRKNGAWVSAGGTLIFGNLTETGSTILTITGGTGAVIGTGTTIQVKQASASQSGFLSSGDWTTFNGKQNSLTFGNFTEVTSSVLTITGGTGAIIGSGLTVQVKQASGSQNGYLSSTDWTTFNSKLNGNKGIKTVVLCSAFTPAFVGADTAEVPIPFASDGSSLTFTITRLSLRVNITGGAPAITIEKSSVAGAFTPTSVGSLTLTTGASQGTTTTSLGNVTSGDKLRFNVTTLATAQNWTITVEIAP